MRDHSALRAGAFVGVVLAVAVASAAQAQPPNRMLGPNYPALIDTNGRGKPTEATDVKAVPSRSGTQVTIGNPWDTCAGGNTNNKVTLTGMDDKGKYRSSTGARKDGGSQGASMTGFDGSSKPNSFAGTYSRKAGTQTFVGTGTGSFTGSGPIPNGFHITINAGTTTNIDSGFVFSDADGDGNPDYISVPFATQSLLGVKPFPRSCTVPGAGSGNPQIWIPLADSDGDGVPDSVVFDLDGNGQADPDLYESPRLVASPCVYAVNPSAKTAPAAGESNSFALTTGNASCNWSATSNAAWLTLPVSTGTGDATVGYVVAPNTSTSSRTGTITVNGQTFTVTQAGIVIVCTYGLNPTTVNAPTAGGAFTSALTASHPTCTWTATSADSWITVTAPASGTGSGTVSFSVAANPTFYSRTGTVTAGGQTLTVVQAAAVPTQVIPTLSEWGLAALGLALALAGWALLRRGGLGI